MAEKCYELLRQFIHHLVKCELNSPSTGQSYANSIVRFQEANDAVAVIANQRQNDQVILFALVSINGADLNLIDHRVVSY